MLRHSLSLRVQHNIFCLLSRYQLTKSFSFHFRRHKTVNWIHWINGHRIYYDKPIQSIVRTSKPITHKSIAIGSVSFMNWRVALTRYVNWPNIGTNLRNAFTSLTANWHVWTNEIVMSMRRWDRNSIWKIPRMSYKWVDSFCVYLKNEITCTNTHTSLQCELEEMKERERERDEGGRRKLVF